MTMVPLILNSNDVLEAALGDDSRAVVVRRKYIERQSKRYIKMLLIN